MKITLVAVASLFLAGCNSTSQGTSFGTLLTGERNETVESLLVPGHSLVLGPFARVDHNCRVVGQARGRILQRPAFGFSTISKAEGEIAFLPGANLSKCNDLPARGTTITYRSKPDHFGDDRFRFRLIFPDGEVRDISVNVHRRSE